MHFDFLLRFSYSCKNRFFWSYFLVREAKAPLAEKEGDDEEDKNDQINGN